MTIPIIEKALTEIVAEYTKRDEIKELCISLGKSGDITIGGRTLLISEIEKEQPFSETIGCIQVVFAASSDSIFFDKDRHSSKPIDELQALLKRKKELITLLSNFSIEKLVSIAPKLEMISVDNKW